jgi:hypothetical protein
MRFSFASPAGSLAQDKEAKMAQLGLKQSSAQPKQALSGKYAIRSKSSIRTCEKRMFALLFSILLLTSSVVQAQDSKKPQAENSSNSVRLKATTTVGSCINVEAVLLAKKPAAMLFGGFVAENYAVVKTTVSNKCDDQQFILHDIYFDYRNWALSGVYPEIGSPLCSGPPAIAGKNQLAAEAGPPNSAKSQQNTSSQSITGGGGDSPAANDNEAKPSTTGTQSTVSSAPPNDGGTTRGTCPGQVATVGALDVQDQDTEDAVFSPRNKAVKAITLIGQVASGYAFIWSGDAAKGIGAYNSAFVENVNKLWPDRRIDQEKNILSLGYRTDRSTAIAKDDHGSYYAFFPLKVFLSPTLTRLFLDSPAVFLNPAESLFEYSLGRHDSNTATGTGISQNPDRNTKKESSRITPLVRMLLDLTDGIETQARSRFKPTETQATNKISQLLIDLASPCPKAPCPFLAKSQSDEAKNQDESAQDSNNNYDLYRILAEKYLFQRASLNSVQIVVRGVMTVSVDSVPPTIDDVTCDKEKESASWTVTDAAPSAAQSASTPASQDSSKPVDTKTKPSATNSADSTQGDGTQGTTIKGNALSCSVAGKFLANGTPGVQALSIPTISNVKLTDYIGTVQNDPLKSSDASLPFTMQLLKSLPNGSKLTFMVTRKLPVSGADSEGSSPGSGKQVSSNQYVYTVSFDISKASTTTAPHIDDLVMDSETKIAVWQNSGKGPVVRSGKVTGTNLTHGTVSITDFEVGDKTTDYKSYVGTITTKSSAATELDFDLELLKTVPDGSKLTLTVEKKSGNTTETSNSFKYPVKKLVVKPAQKPAPKPAPQPKPSPKK